MRTACSLQRLQIQWNTYGWETGRNETPVILPGSFIGLFARSGQSTVTIAAPSQYLDSFLRGSNPVKKRGV